MDLAGKRILFQGYSITAPHRSRAEVGDNSAEGLGVGYANHDTWHEFNNANGVEIPRFETIYQLMLEMTRAALPDVTLVLCEPFALPCGAVSADWLPDVAARIDVVHRLADQFGAVLVPFQKTFDNAVGDDSAYWAYDGVHPPPAGHQIMPDAWLKAVRAA